MNIYERLRAAGNICLHFVFPEQCPVCGKLATPGCESCVQSLVVPLLPRCPVCGRPYPCSVHKSIFPLMSGNFHEGLNRTLVLNLKYGSDSGLGRVIGRALADKLKRPSVDCLVPVPLHKRSRRHYNQAKLIALGLSEIWEKPVVDILSWRSVMPSQVSKSSTERRVLSEDSVASIRRGLEGKKVLLVDDVSTTGTTLRICGKAVSKSGGSVEGAVTWTVSAY